MSELGRVRFAAAVRSFLARFVVYAPLSIVDLTFLKWLHTDLKPRGLHLSWTPLVRYHTFIQVGQPGFETNLVRVEFEGVEEGTVVFLPEDGLPARTGASLGVRTFH